MIERRGDLPCRDAANPLQDHRRRLVVLGKLTGAMQQSAARIDYRLFARTQSDLPAADPEMPIELDQGVVGEIGQQIVRCEGCRAFALQRRRSLEGLVVAPIDEQFALGVTRRPTAPAGR